MQVDLPDLYLTYIPKKSTINNMSLITLRTDKATCTISTLGAQVLECIINQQPLFHTSSNPKRSGIPILFPFAGGLSNNEYKGVKFKQHGFARDCEWEVLDEEEDSATLVLASDMLDETTKAMYPNKFMITMDYELAEDCLIMQMEVSAFDHDIEIAPGIHPYFTTQNELVTNLGEYTQNLEANAKVHDYQPFELKTSDNRIIEFQDNGQSTRLIQWTDSPEYYCVEPWTRDFNGMNADPIVVKTGTSWVWNMQWSLV